MHFLIRSKPRRNLRSGITLLEVTISLALLGTFSFAFLQTQIWGMRATREAQQELTVSRYLSNELEAWRAAALSGGFHLESPAPRAIRDEAKALEAFQSTVSVAPADDAPAGLYRVEVQVTWTAPGARKTTRRVATLCAVQEVQR